ncbi:hypothetical protein NM208_g1801 [Fusarium decemcellulare]|uniref:Uncharacterized protein n=1 Tax=Fusarium decemcellulare TaxID=57161 RepID=A0ACC1SUZ8_9HYPO|nr:hypothetical protein NM208_g1801 [Fusarium decemcellulare]
MLRASLRSVSRPTIVSLRPNHVRRFASTATCDGSRSWQSSAVRLGLAVGVFYYCSTGSVFAEPISQPVPASAQSDHNRPAVDSIVKKRNQIQTETEMPAPKKVEPAEAPEPQAYAQSAMATDDRTASDEEDASQQGAFNPETGEFNWDCSCLGGMAHGPCGEEFKAAFSCFMLSTEEPKGIGCIDKFQVMQTCFRKYPEVYGAELADDEGTPSPSFSDEHPEPSSQSDNINIDETSLRKHKAVKKEPGQSPKDGAGREES